MQFGISGTGIGMEESKSTAVGRRDLFKLDGGNQAKPPIGGRGRGAPSGRPPMQNRKTPVQRGNFKHSAADEEEKVGYTAFGGDFNLAGTQISTTATNFTSPTYANSASHQKPDRTGRLAHRQSFKNGRPNSLDHRPALFGAQEESKGDIGLGGSSLAVGGNKLTSLSNGSNKHRLVKDIQQYREVEERDFDFLEEQ